MLQSFFAVLQFPRKRIISNKLLTIGLLFPSMMSNTFCAVKSRPGTPTTAAIRWTFYGSIFGPTPTKMDKRRLRSKNSGKAKCSCFGRCNATSAASIRLTSRWTVFQRNGRITLSTLILQNCPCLSRSRRVNHCNTKRLFG